MSPNPPELSGGSLTICTAQAIYPILISGGVACAAAGAPEDEGYYYNLSHDIYREVGRLARRLSMSIRDVKIQKMDALDFQSVNQQFEQVKDQLENVVKTTGAGYLAHHGPWREHPKKAPLTRPGASWST